jgi:hypothetical protein
MPPVLPPALLQGLTEVYSPAVFTFAHAVPAGRFLSIVVGDGHGRLNTVTGLSDSRGNTYFVDAGAEEPDNDGTIFMGHSILDTAIQAGDTLSVTFLSNVPPYASGPGSSGGDGIWWTVDVAATAFTEIVDSSSPVDYAGFPHGFYHSSATVFVDPLLFDPMALVIGYSCAELGDGVNDTSGAWSEFLNVIDVPSDIGGTIGPYQGVTANQLMGSWQVVESTARVNYVASSASGNGAAVICAYAVPAVPPVPPVGVLKIGPGSHGVIRLD